ncbi:MAG: amidohydrolase family protein, partial [Polaromonas sp.]|nr:amidohydrolase family protein [Polaromonas sp.]
MRVEPKNYAASQAWVNGAWAQDVVLTVGADGLWLNIQSNATPEALRDAERLNGPVLPGLVNAHSHAFQRAIAGLTERAGAGRDDFWRWRDRMYSAALRITPEQLEAVAALLYAELLQAGYTQVCEFHYLHNNCDGKPYADPLEMSLALVRAAQRVGMGLTLLPTLYMRSGFTATGLREDQRRFASTPESVLRLAEGVLAPGHAGINAGLALHSLRAVDAAALQEVAAAAQARGMAVHIHIAEQTQEVDDCLAATGQRPIDWLLSHAPVDARWNLVHATQSIPAELQGVSRSGASIVICPSTEANLGDGV